MGRLHDRAMILVLILFSVVTSLHTHYASAQNASGNWSDPRTWGGSVPDDGASVTIPSGQTVVLDRSSVRLRSLTIDGTLIFGALDIQLSADVILVHGTLQIGSAAAPHPHRATIILTGSNTSENIMGMGTKVLGSMGGGRILLYGAPRTSWVRLNAHAPAGSSQITLDSPVDWRAGDQVVIAPTGMNAREAEQRTIASISGTTVTLTQPLTFAHWGERLSIAGRSIDTRAAVGLLTRSIRIQSDNGSAVSNFGGHVMIMSGGDAAQISNVEFVGMGQLNRLGRYPMHWHLVRDARGSLFVNNSIHNSIQRGLVVHGTDNLVIRNNVIFNTVGHNFVTEDGTETGNLFENNLAILARRADLSQEALVNQNDTLATNFWIRGGANRWVGNIAAGAEGNGFWFDEARGAVQRFENNTAHSSGQTSCRVATNPSRTCMGFAVEGGEGFALTARGLLAFQNGSGYWSPQEILVIEDSVFVDNFVGVSLHSDLRNSLIVGRSRMPQTRVTSWGDWRLGMDAYGGMHRLTNVTFAEFTRDDEAMQIFGNRELTRYFVSGLRFINVAQPVRFTNITDGVVIDLDGSLGGRPNAMIVGRAPSMAVPSSCSAQNDWAAWICPPMSYQEVWVEDANGGFDHPIVREGDNAAITLDWWGIMLVSGQQYRFTRGLEATSSLSIRVGPYMDTRNWNIFRVPVPNDRFAVRSANGQPLRQVASRAALNTTTDEHLFFYDRAQNMVEIRIALNISHIELAQPWVFGADYYRQYPNIIIERSSQSIAPPSGSVLPGDANGDGAVTLADFSILSASFNRAVGQPGFDARADFNGDGMVDLRDFSVLSANFNRRA